MTCPCGSGAPLADCCGRFHDGTLAGTAEQLMRSRYSAFALDRTDYLLATWHADTRPAVITPEPGLYWRRLEVIGHEPSGGQATVHYRATWQQGQRWGQLQEQARFVQDNGRWLYVDGDVTTHALDPTRNAACPCGSGAKFKRCCLNRPSAQVPPA